MRDFETADAARLRAALGRIARLLDRQSTGGGLTRTQLSVLGTLARRGPLMVRELADIEGINPTMLSRILAKFDEEGLIRRSSAPDDRRTVRVEVSSTGAQMHQRLRAERTRLLEERLAALPKESSAELLAALPALETLADQLSQRPTVSSPRLRERAQAL